MTTRRRQSSRPVSSRKFKKDILELNSGAKAMLAGQAHALAGFINNKPEQQQTESEKKMVATVTSDIAYYSNRIDALEKHHDKFDRIDSGKALEVSFDLGGKYTDIIDSAHATITPLIAQLLDNAEGHIDEQLKKVTGATP